MKIIKEATTREDHKEVRCNKGTDKGTKIQDSSKDQDKIAMPAIKSAQQEFPSKVH